MEINGAIQCLLDELRRAERKFPAWPIDAVHAAAIVAEEAGELQKAALEYTYEKQLKRQMMAEAIHTGAMAIRFLINMHTIRSRPAKPCGRVRI